MGVGVDGHCVTTTPEQHSKYNRSPKGRARARRYDLETGRTKQSGPKGSAGPEGAAAQRRLRALPEYQLASRLGVKVAVAREILQERERPPE